MCKFKAHKRCAVRATNNCKWTTLASIGKDIIEDEDGVGSGGPLALPPPPARAQFSSSRLGPAPPALWASAGASAPVPDRSSGWAAPGGPCLASACVRSSASGESVQGHPARAAVSCGALGQCVSPLGLQVAMPHQWLEGNLPVSAKCTVCDKTCGSVLRLQDWRCLWCKAMVSTPGRAPRAALEGGRAPRQGAWGMRRRRGRL